MNPLVIFKKDYPQLKKYQILNLALAAFYLIQAVCLFFVADFSRTKGVHATFLSQNYLTNNFQETFARIFDFPLIYPLLFILVVCFLCHLFCGLRLSYSHQILKQRYHPWRWLISGGLGGLILALTAIMLGLTDIIVLIFVISAIGIFALSNALVEFLAAKKDSVLKELDLKGPLASISLNRFFYGWLRLLSLGVCLAIGFALIANLIWGRSGLGVVYWLLYFNSLLLVLSWLLNLFLRRKKLDKWGDYFWFENSIMISSFIFISNWVWLAAYLPI